MQDHELAGLLAQEAGDLLLGIRGQAVAEGWPSYRLQDEGDRQAHRHLVDRLAELRPDDGLLSEEGTDDGARLEANRVWILAHWTGHATSAGRKALNGRSTWPWWRGVGRRPLP